jgi:hypothetical protein
MGRASQQSVARWHAPTLNPANWLNAAPMKAERLPLYLSLVLNNNQLAGCCINITPENQLVQIR